MEDAMDGVTRVDLQGVVAPLNFMVPMAEKPYSYNYDPPPGVLARNGQLIEHNVTIHDARPVNDALSLDREGFVLLRRQTAAADLYDEAIITSVYYPECERLMKEATGATRVVAFDHIVRNSAKAAIKGSGVKMPAGRVHNDYTVWSAPQRVRDLMGDRNVSTTLIQPGLEFKLWCSALVQWLYGLVTRLSSGESPGRSRFGPSSCLGSA
jgi:hypothetical protein